MRNVGYEPTFYFATPRDLLNKLRRDFVRLEAAVAGHNKENIADALFDFANAAYSIKDWLKENSNGNFSAQDVETYMETHAVLNACRDICNANKHYVISRYMPITKDVYASASATNTLALPPVLATGFHLETEPAPAFRVKVLLLDNTKFEVVSFARQAVSAWEAFFTRFAI